MQIVRYLIETRGCDSAVVTGVSLHVLNRDSLKKNPFTPYYTILHHTTLHHTTLHTTPDIFSVCGSLYTVHSCAILSEILAGRTIGRL